MRGRRVLTVACCLVLLAAGGAVYQVVRRSNHDSAIAAPSVSTVAAAPGFDVAENGLAFRMPAAPGRSTINVSSALPGATDVKWALQEGSMLTTLQFLQLPAKANSDGGDRFARSVLAALLKTPGAQINVTARPVVEGAVARYYEIGIGTQIRYVYTVVKGRTVIALVANGDSAGAPAAFTMARANLTYDGAPLG
jgi:hypothetical protein